MSDDDLAAHEDGEPIQAGLMAMVESMLPMYETAEGQRKLLEERGWSSAAERIAAELLCGMVRVVFK